MLVKKVPDISQGTCTTSGGIFNHDTVTNESDPEF